MKIKDIFAITSLPVIAASLCCITPIVVLLAGLGTATLASTMADILYGEYRWVFRLFGFVLLLGAIFFYLRRQRGICTLDEAKKRRTEIFNIVLISLAFGIVGYFFFLYVVVHYIGVFLGIWR
ncbi:hypothetical protein A3C86_02265 [Candidatus Kaiserbacteria bacterium RIFCSPHIGHO2_02_FULL_49_16]|uniref:Mercuric transport protein MerT n=1 Tax=Candidatus Kaiserbacteria bacterium RIFCSPHIGHO2_02_FULL_49_16 TaxID=1798490 RepID=A0A1F6DBM2_9BACT|nr:MAG: hypothetical protein A3C86_02265 [Candidatus Kaiserbacteria bacterium RIFCSPHIGHO2_02_FULL_49_16]